MSIAIGHIFLLADYVKRLYYKNEEVEILLRIRELRESKSLQQKELAIDLGVTQPTISDWESGRKIPSAKNTAKLADYFGVSVDYLLGREETPAPETQDGSEDREIREYLQMIKDDPKYRIMFDLAKDASLEEIKATAAFLRALREQRD